MTVTTAPTEQLELVEEATLNGVGRFMKSYFCVADRGVSYMLAHVINYF